MFLSRRDERDRRVEVALVRGGVQRRPDRLGYLAVRDDDDLVSRFCVQFQRLSCILD